MSAPRANLQPVGDFEYDVAAAGVAAASRCCKLAVLGHLLSKARLMSLWNFFRGAATPLARSASACREARYIGQLVAWSMSLSELPSSGRSADLLRSLVLVGMLVVVLPYVLCHGRHLNPAAQSPEPADTAFTCCMSACSGTPRLRMCVERGISRQLRQGFSERRAAQLNTCRDQGEVLLLYSLQSQRLCPVLTAISNQHARAQRCNRHSTCAMTAECPGCRHG